MKKSEILTRSHAVTRETLRAYPTADYHVTLAAALRIVWSEARSENDPRAAWDAMSGEEKLSALRGMVWHRAKVCRAECDRMGNPRANNYIFLDEEHDGDLQIVDDAFLRMPSALARNAATPDPAPLSIILARVCDRAAQYLRRTEHRHASALRLDATTSEDGKTAIRDYIDTADHHSADRAANPEPATLAAETLRAACLDDTDRAIVKLAAYGLNQSETATALRISQQTVSRRLAAIRARYHGIA